MCGVISLQTKWSKGQKQILYHIFFYVTSFPVWQKKTNCYVLYMTWYNKKPAESVELIEI